MAKRIGGAVGAVVLLILVVTRCGGQEVGYVDPFPEGMETAFAEAGLPIVASRINDNPHGYDHDVGIILQVDPEACLAKDQECLKDLLEAQPWTKNVGPAIAPTARYVLQFHIDKGRPGGCSATGGPADEWEHVFDEQGWFQEIESLEPHMWYFFLYCADGRPDAN